MGENTLSPTAAKGSRLDKAFANLQIIRNGKPTKSLTIANFMKDGLAENQLIGKRWKGKNYFIDLEKGKKQIQIWKNEGKKRAEIEKLLGENPPLGEEIPADYPKPINVDNHNNIYTVEKLNPTLSQDDFQFKLEDKTLTGQGPLEITLQAYNPLSPQDPPRYLGKISLTEDPNNPGHFYSESLFLTSIPDMVDLPIEGKTDASPKQIFLVKLDDVVTGIFQRKEKKYIASADVPTEQILPTKVIILVDENDNPAGTAEQVENLLYGDTQQVIARTY